MTEEDPPTRELLLLEHCFSKGGGFYRLDFEHRRREALQILKEFRGEEVDCDPLVVEFMACLLFENNSTRATYFFGGISLEEGPYHLAIVHQNDCLPVAGCLNGDLICLDFNQAPSEVVIVNSATLGESLGHINIFKLSSLKFFVASVLTNNPFMPIDSGAGWKRGRFFLAYLYNKLKLF